MPRRLFYIALIFNFLSPLASIGRSFAQGDDATLQPYTSEDFGVQMDIPADWVVEADTRQLIAGIQTDVTALQSFQVPAGLVITMTTSTYNSMGVQNAAQLQTVMGNFAPTGATLSEVTSISFGDASGYSVEFAIPDSTAYTQVVLLTIPGARIAVVRGLAPNDVWAFSAKPLFTAIMESAVFGLPSNMSDPLGTLPDSDGGVLWHYQTAQSEDKPTLNLGGITYDDFGTMYIAGGPRGILALNKTDGTFVNFLGPIFDDDNFRDVAIGPRDALLYFANATSGDNNHILVTDRLGNFVRGWGATGDGVGQFAIGMPRSLAVTRRGEVWVVSEGHLVEPRDRLYRFDSLGNLLATINLVDVNPELKNIAVDNNITTDGLFLVGQRGGLNLLDSDGSILVPNVAKDILTEAVPLDIAVGPGGLMVIATENNGFMQFTNLGELVDRFGFPYDTERGGLFQPGEFSKPIGTVVDANGTIYAAETNRDTGYAQVQAFSFTGAGNLALPGREAPADGQQTIFVASAGGEISIGDVMHGHLDNQAPQNDFILRLVAGDSIVITMKSLSPEAHQGALDPTIILLDNALNEIGRNDDASNPPEGIGSRDAILRFSAGSDGTYTIRATRFGGSGDYELSVERVSQQ